MLSILEYQCYAQGQYQTKNGVISIASASSEHGERPTLHSSKLSVTLNMKTAEFDFILPIQSLHSGVDSIDSRLYREEYNNIQVSGMMNMDGVKTQPHTPIHFVFKAILKYKDLVHDLNGEGHLEHIPGNEQPACRLRLNFNIEDFELYYGFRSDFRFQIMQSILYQGVTN